MKKIAFCFLIYDEFNHEDIWNLFFQNIPPDKYNIYIHYKNNKPLKYFEKYKLHNCIDTKYDDFTIPLAYNLLFKEAFENDANNFKFCILSNSCIPLKSFNHIYNKLSADDKAYFNICDSSHCYPNCNPLLDFYDKKYISKSHNWFILNRELVQKISIECNHELPIYYKDIYAPAEYFYYTKVKMLGLEEQLLFGRKFTKNCSCIYNYDFYLKFITNQK